MESVHKAKLDLTIMLEHYQIEGLDRDWVGMRRSYPAANHRAASLVIPD